MIRLSLYLLLLLSTSLAISWLLEHDGQFTLNWLGYQIEASISVMIVVLSMAVILSTLLLYGVLRIRLALRRTGALYHEKRKNSGLQALYHGMAALAAGDTEKAKKMMRRISMETLPAAGLLHAQIAQAEGNPYEASEYLQSMLPYVETELIALRGLALQAYEDKNYPEAIRLAEKALAIQPAMKWALVLLADLYQSLERWNQALIMLESIAKHKLLTSAEVKRQTAQLLYRRSQTSGDNALYYAELAYKTHGTMDIALLLVALLIQQDKKSRALRILKKEWKQAPHPKLASLFLMLYEQETSKKKLSNMEHFIAVNPQHHESHVALAKAAMDAGELSKARSSLRAAIAIKETRHACMLMAALEKKSYGDSEMVEEWLQRALAVSMATEEAPQKKPVRHQIEDLSQVI